ncbi:MAG: biopolymer transporter ExbD [candidate division WOR-3 bacterium]
MKKKGVEFTPPITEINVTPLVDICLVLVIIFLCFAPAIYLSGITVTRAKATRAASQQAPTEVKVNIYLTSEGHIVLNEEVVEAENLASLVEQLLLRSPTKTVTISADPEVRHERVVWVLDLARQAGAVNLCILKRRTGEG